MVLHGIYESLVKRKTLSRQVTAIKGKSFLKE